MVNAVDASIARRLGRAARPVNQARPRGRVASEGCDLADSSAKAGDRGAKVSVVGAVRLRGEQNMGRNDPELRDNAPSRELRVDRQP